MQSLRQLLPEQGDAYSGTTLALRLRRSCCTATPIPITITASVANRLPGAMQLIQVPMIVDASYTAADLPLPIL